MGPMSSRLGPGCPGGGSAGWTWRWWHKIGRGVLECVVCLMAFEEAEDLRLLPHCLHAFHPECIDPWLELRRRCKGTRRPG
uniref:RING-type E3 ubiquitin transferase n=3 Tax=Aegilops tauschii subsp. strangulata TaxID=200361 RepID=A0A452ZXQ7_AEGTS